MLRRSREWFWRRNVLQRSSMRKFHMGSDVALHLLPRSTTFNYAMLEELYIDITTTCPKRMTVRSTPIQVFPSELTILKVAPSFASRESFSFAVERERTLIRIRSIRMIVYRIVIDLQQ